MIKLKKYRLEQNMTLQELSILSQVSIGYLCHLENGTRCNPSYKTMQKISFALNKDIAEVF